MSSPLRADCAPALGAEKLDPVLKPSIVKIETTAVQPGCTGHGTGFLISPGGFIMTAGHVVDPNCENQAIVGLIAGETTPVQLEIAERSQLDVAILRIRNPARSFPSLSLIRPMTDRRAYEGVAVAIASFYREYPRPTITSARIDSVDVIGEPRKWGLCATAANPGRSGSPVALQDGTIVAVFTERPSNGEQDIARVIPLAEISDLTTFTAPDAGLIFVGSPRGATPPLPVNVQSPEQLLYEFNINEVARAHRSPFDKKDRYLNRNGVVTAASHLSGGSLAVAIMNGAKLRFAEPFTSRFQAPPGFKFDKDFFDLRLESHNPTRAPLPLRRCTGQSSDCHAFSADGRSLILNYRLFAGPLGDAARGWLRGSVVTKLIPTSVE